VKIAALITILLAHNGYWFGDRAADVSFALAAPAPAGHVTWQLMFGAAEIAHGATDIAAGANVTIKVTPPKVRTRSNCRLVYTFTDAAGKLLESGEAPVSLFPDDLFAGMPRMMQGQRVAVWGEGVDPLAAFLDRAAVPHELGTGSVLGFERPQVLLVGPGALDGVGALARPPLVELARRGASVIVFRQSSDEQLAGYSLVRRTVPAEMGWRVEHPLLSSLQSSDWATLVPPASEQVAVRLPLGEPALEVTYWPAEVGKKVAAPVDALVVTRTIGKGRIVFCQLPLPGDWETDPRSQTFMRAALEYACTPPGPTPPPGKRGEGADRGERNESDRNILTPGGN
jgi:hypothetical protein